MNDFVSHPLIKPRTIERRSYQGSLAETALKKSTMIVLPTGLGKTVIALLVIVNRLEKGKCLFLSPTKPLVEQHANFLRNTLNIDPSLIQVFTGSIPPEKRWELWKRAKVVVSTPQVIENDLFSKKIDLKDVSQIIFDECHRAVGNYSYVYIAQKYAQQRKDPHVLGITASPGSDTESIVEVCENLGIEMVEARSEYDPEVAPYVYRKDIEWVKVRVPVEIEGLRRLMEEVLAERMDTLYKLGLITHKKEDISKTELLELQEKIQSELRIKKEVKFYQGISILAEILKIRHGIELIETQGISSLKRYLERLKNEARSSKGSKASKRLLREKNILKVIDLLNRYTGEHPKLEAVKKIVEKQIKENPESRIIIFTNFRDTAEMLTNSLRFNGIKPIKFVGQTNKYKDKGLTQKQQVEIIEKFSRGDYNVLVATSVAEEGLDIPSTDLVIFYEPVPSEIRSIQRKGRTGRKRIGKVIVLIAKDTKDEAYHWISRKKERKMYKEIRDIKEDGFPILENENLPDLSDFEKGAKIFADRREMKSPVIKFLENLGCEVELKTLEVGDYVVGTRVCIERKTAEDFLSSLVDAKREFFERIADMKRYYEKPLLIIEGKGLYTRRKIHPNAIRGALASIALDFGIPILETESAEETASFISVIAKKEEKEGYIEGIPHAKKSSMTLKQQQEYLISSISNIGPVIARNLLRHFGTVEKVVSAPKEELMKVERVGPAIAERIRKVVGTKYE
ncbi:MAG: DEAD/DEAH box helicase [Candidatus Syntropharchaeia archaeon]